MVNLAVLISLLIVALVNYVVIDKLNKNTLAFSNSIVFFLNSVFLVSLLNWFENTASIEDVSSSIVLDKLISIDAAAVRVRNTVVIVSLFYLTYGTYKEYVSNKKKFALVISLVLLTVSVLYLVGALLVGAFII